MPLTRFPALLVALLALQAGSPARAANGIGNSVGPAAEDAATCRRETDLARERFKGLGILTEKEADEACKNARRTPEDRENNQGRGSFCLRAWNDMRVTRDAYLQQLNETCMAARREARRCDAMRGSDAESAQRCMENNASVALDGEEKAKAALEIGLAQIVRNGEIAKTRYDNFDSDDRAIKNASPTMMQGTDMYGDMVYSAFLTKARQAGFTDPKEYGRRASELAFEQQRISNAAGLFRETADLERVNRQVAINGLNDIKSASKLRGEGMSTVTGESKGGPGVGGAHPGTPDRGIGSVSNSTLDAAAGATKALAAAAKNSPDDKSSASSVPNATGGKVGPEPGKPSATAQARSPASQSGPGAPGGTPSGNATKDSTPAKGAAARGEGYVPDNYDHSRIDLDASSGGVFKPKLEKGSLAKQLSAALPGSGDPGSSREVKASSADGKHGPSKADPEPGTSQPEGTEVQAAGGTNNFGAFGASGQLGPSKPLLDNQELSPEALLGLDKLSGKGDSELLTDEEKKWLGLDSSSPIKDVKEARALLAERAGTSGASLAPDGTYVPSNSHTGSFGAPMAGPDSPGLFARVKIFLVRAQKRGWLVQLHKKI